MSDYEKIAAFIESFGATYYPEDIFPKPTPGCAPDLYSAAMARHLCRLFAGKIRSGEALDAVEVPAPPASAAPRPLTTPKPEETP